MENTENFQNFFNIIKIIEKRRMCIEKNDRYKYVTISSSDLLTGINNDFTINLLPSGLKIKKAILLSSVIPNTITSPTINSHIYIRISGMEQNAFQGNNGFTYCIPFVVNSVNVFRQDWYEQIMDFGNGKFFSQQVRVQLLDGSFTPCSFNSVNDVWSFVIKIEYEY
jgi:hypothetical protein